MQQFIWLSCTLAHNKDILYFDICIKILNFEVWWGYHSQTLQNYNFIQFSEKIAKIQER